MGSESVLLLVAVFFLGAAVGGLLVSIERASRIDRLRDEFRQELENALQREATVRARDSQRQDDVPPGKKLAFSDLAEPSGTDLRWTA